MRIISDENNSISNYKFIEKSKDLLVEIQLNQYDKAQFVSSNTPKKVAKYSYQSKKLTEIIPVAIQDKMQNLVEGR